MSSSSLVSPNVVFHHLTDPVESTQDESRRLLQQQQQQHNKNHTNNKAVAVLADIQTRGRGTQGRKWERGDGGSSTASSSDGNLYLTVSLPLDRIPVTLTLLPLQIGVLVAERISKLMAACASSGGGAASTTAAAATAATAPKVTVKWPNDVLVNDQKISGTLIENENVPQQGTTADGTSSNATTTTTWLLIGIGVNVASAPRDLSPSPGKQVRPACCIQDFCHSLLPAGTALALGQDLASALADWAYASGDDDNNTNSSVENKMERERQIRERWISFAEFGQEYELRGQRVDEENGGYQGERVVTVGIQADGQLRVRGADGRERNLVADYLF